MIVIGLIFLLVACGYFLIAWRYKLKEQEANWLSPEAVEQFKITQHGKMLEEATALYEKFRTTELDRMRVEEKEIAIREAILQVQQWKISEERKIREDAVGRSQAITIGKVTEHLVPYFLDFPHNPHDCRFVGAPIDLLIFKGLSEGELEKIIFMEIKTANSTLSKRERQIRDIIKAGKVEWEERRIKSKEQTLNEKL